MLVEYFFDPRCPWTWLTSRWLVEAAAQRHFTPSWRAFDLDCISSEEKVPARERSSGEGARIIQRVVEALAAEGRNDDAGLVYTTYGARVHTNGEHADAKVAQEIVEQLTLEGSAYAVHDEELDKAVEASTIDALSLVGDGVGSPVLAVTRDGHRRGMFGPIQAPSVTDGRAGALWDAVLMLLQTPEVAEIKRDRGIELPLPPAVRHH